MSTTIAGTVLSSRGQVVIPEELRKEMHLEVGTKFMVFREEDVLMLKVMKAPSRRGLARFLKIAREQARAAGMTKKDLDRTIAEIRSKK